MTEVYSHEVTVPDLFDAPGYGLLDNVVWLTGDADGHWRGGIQYEADCPSSLPTISECFPSAPGDIADKADTWDHVFRGSRAFTIFGEWSCSPAGQGLTLSDLESGRTKALRALAMSSPRAVERVFWTGSVSNSPAVVYPNLNKTTQVLDGAGQGIVLQPSATVITGTKDVVEALGKLEDAVASCYDGRAWIHVPSILIASLAGQGLVFERGGKLYTTAGNRVIIGRGYDDTVGPDGGTNSGVTQMWATSPVFGLKDTPQSFGPVESFDRNVNTMKYIAEQTFILGWTCCLIGVTVTLGGEVAGTVNSAS